MDVPGAGSSCVEGIWAQDLAVRCDDEGVEVRDLGGCFGDTSWLEQGKVGGVGQVCYGCWGSLAAAAPAGVWLGEHQRYVVV